MNIFTRKAVSSLVVGATFLLVTPAYADTLWSSLGSDISSANAGNVGIGTTTPQAKLAVIGDISAVGSLTSFTSGEILRALSGGTAPVTIRLENNGADTYFGIEGSTGGGYFTGALPYATVIYGNTAVQNIIGGTARTTLLNNGHFGIGTTTPSEALHVQGNIKLTGNIVSDGDICIGACS